MRLRSEECAELVGKQRVLVEALAAGNVAQLSPDERAASFARYESEVAKLEALRRELVRLHTVELAVGPTYD